MYIMVKFNGLIYCNSDASMLYSVRERGREERQCHFHHNYSVLTTCNMNYQWNNDAKKKMNMS